MKKILLLIAGAGLALNVFAADAVAFDSNHMKCGEHELSSSSFNSKDLKDYNCKKLKVKKDQVTFFDDNSKKLVTCKADKAGNVAVAECK